MSENPIPAEAPSLVGVGGARLVKDGGLYRTEYGSFYSVIDVGTRLHVTFGLGTRDLKAACLRELELHRRLFVEKFEVDEVRKLMRTSRKLAGGRVFLRRGWYQHQLDVGGRDGVCFSLDTKDKKVALERMQQLRKWLFEEKVSVDEARQRLKALRVGIFSIQPETIEVLTEGRACRTTLAELFQVFKAHMRIGTDNIGVFGIVCWLVYDAVTEFEPQDRRTTKSERNDKSVTDLIGRLPATVFSVRMLDAAKSACAPAAGSPEENAFHCRVEQALTLVAPMAMHFYKDEGFILPSYAAERSWQPDLVKLALPCPPLPVVEEIYRALRAEWRNPAYRHRCLAIGLALHGLQLSEIHAAQWSWLRIDPEWGPIIDVQKGEDFTPGPHRSIIPISQTWFDALDYHRRAGSILDGTKVKRDSNTSCPVRAWLMDKGLSCTGSGLQALRNLYGMMLAGEANMHAFRLSLRLGVWVPEHVEARMMSSPLGSSHRLLWQSPIL